MAAVAAAGSGVPSPPWPNPPSLRASSKSASSPSALGTACRRPEVNVWIETEDGHLKVDFLWRRERLVVETDGYGFHRSRGSFERDHRRDGLLSLSGWRVQRFTWRQVTREEEQTVRTVRAALR